MKKDENLYRVYGKMFNVEPRDLLLANLYFAFDYAKANNLDIDHDSIFDSYNNELKKLDLLFTGK